MHSDHEKGVDLALRRRNQLHVCLVAGVIFQSEHAGICLEYNSTWTQKMTNCIYLTLRGHMIDDRLNA